MFLVSHLSMSIWLRRNILNRLVDAVDGVGIFVGNFNAELFLDRHHHLDRVQAIQAQVATKMRCCVNLVMLVI